MVVIGVHEASGSAEEIAATLREKGVPYPVLRDTDSRETFSAYRVMGVPHYVLVGKDGTILADGISLSRIEQLVRKQLGETP